MTDEARNEIQSASQRILAEICCFALLVGCITLFLAISA